MLSYLNDTKLPVVWYKIVKLLYLCSQISDTPDELFIHFHEHLTQILEIPPHQCSEIVSRLAAAEILTGDETSIEIDISRILLFLENGFEEYINENLDSPTHSKVYQTCQYLLTRFHERVERELAMLISERMLNQHLKMSSLWSSLRPALQEQRVQCMISYLIDNQLVKLEDEEERIIRIRFQRLQEFPVPIEEIRGYEAIKSALMK
jgi:hypothetical protein